MTRINGLPRIEVRRDGTFLVTRGFSVEGDIGMIKFIIKIKKGFVTDFASVPRFFWRILPPTGKYNVAAIVHDYLYMTGEVSKESADKIFLILMKHLKVSRWKRKVMYKAVRYFGKTAWDKHRKNKI